MGEASSQQSASEDLLRKQSEIEALRTQLANHKVQLEAERQRVRLRGSLASDIRNAFCLA
jgi:hypothetical protein